MDKFQNKYRIPSARATWWNYANNGCYFVTICTAHRETHFGTINNGKMHLSPIGQIAQEFWLSIPAHNSIIDLGTFVVMPNHIHGIIHINAIDAVANPSRKWTSGSLGVIINQFKRICTLKSQNINNQFDWQTRFHDRIIRNDAEYTRIENYINTNIENWEKDDFFM